VPAASNKDCLIALISYYLKRVGAVGGRAPQADPENIAYLIKPWFSGPQLKVPIEQNVCLGSSLNAGRSHVIPLTSDSQH
jgi:hypothetical protein